MTKTKFIFVTGGVASSLGKGIISASIGKLLQARGYSVTIQKLDPYLNIDPGTLNPYEHGECYVTIDGAETDLDLGHYERFLNRPTTQANNVTTGRIYRNVIEKERRGDFLGKTVQIIPHITDEIKRNIKLVCTKEHFDFVITEIGGTVGDIESLPFIEAVRQMKWEHTGQCMFVHLTFVPYLAASGELKTKPTQHSVKQLLETGVQPDVLVLRTEKPLSQDIKRKVGLFCNIDSGAVIESRDLDTIYAVPLAMLDEGLDEIILKKFKLKVGEKPALVPWRTFVEKHTHPKQTVQIALVGKYVELPDAYKSIIESFVHAGATHECKVILKMIHSETLTDENVKEQLGDCKGVLVAPGFGSRGVAGKFIAIRYARENNVPFFGICLGMQCAVIEFARNVLGYEQANSTEMNRKTPYPVIDIMEDQKGVLEMGGTMRLGGFPCTIKKRSLAHKIYQSTDIVERHRHRYEFNNKYLADFEAAGMVATGINPNSHLVEIIEIPAHPWFVAVQFHPEYRSTVLAPHPLFESFIGAALAYAKK
ncbi:MAG: CTP synthase [Bacteroidales bacterium]|jgi:CTP synthase|nr:CTP synthase [Bacteroidales bacterium]